MAAGGPLHRSPQTDYQPTSVSWTPITFSILFFSCGGKSHGVFKDLSLRGVWLPGVCEVEVLQPVPCPPLTQRAIPTGPQRRAR
jgi:hypothetical protein